MHKLEVSLWAALLARVIIKLEGSLFGCLSTKTQDSNTFGCF